MKIKFLLTEVLLVLNAGLFAAPEPDATVIYKRVGGEILKLHIFYPADFQKSDKRSAVLMYHGGAWQKGTPRQFFPHCRYFADRGYVAISASYRLYSEKKPEHTLFHCVEDAKSAIRYLKKNAAKYGIDPAKIITAGSSAGAHLAIGVAVLDKINAPGDDLSVEPTPAAAILFCPVVDADPPPEYRLRDMNFRLFSPIHNLDGKKLPAQLILLGDQDRILTVENAKVYRDKVRALNGVCELLIFPGAKHAAFYQGKYYEEAMPQVEAFLKKQNL